MDRPAATRPTRLLSPGWGWALFGLGLLALLGAGHATAYVEWTSGCLIERVPLSFTGLAPRWGLAPAGALLQIAALLAILAACATGVWLAQDAHRPAVIASAVSWLAVGALASPGYLMTRPRWTSHAVRLGPGGWALDLARVLGLALALTVLVLLIVRTVRSRRGRPARTPAATGWPAVVATVGTDGRPDVTAVALAGGDDGMLVFDALRTDRVILNLHTDPRLSLLIGPARVRVDGTAELLGGADRDRYLAVYLRRYPDRLGRALSDGTAHVLVRPCVAR